ncbi:hypothetical protein GF312_01790, partial [Candidatus Poribacteria bacterium]|nr:hypothetical protein [Candidatus Poribacteria bacterium]
MKRIILILFIFSLLFALSGFCHAEVAWSITYVGNSWDEASSVYQTSDNGYVVAGHTQSFGVGDLDLWVLKLDSIGDVMWQKTYGGINRDSATSIQQTRDGGYVVAGHTDSFGEGFLDIWVLKLNSNGNLIWQKTYGGSYNDYTDATSIQQTRDGGYVV